MRRFPLALITLPLLLICVAIACGSPNPMLTPTPAPDSTQTAAPVLESITPSPFPTASVSTQTAVPTPELSTPSPSSTGPSAKPSITCKLDQEQQNISCQATGYHEGDHLKWAESAGGKTSSGGDVFEFKLHAKTPEVQVSLEACQGSSCDTVETVIDTSYLMPEATDTGDHTSDSDSDGTSDSTSDSASDSAVEMHSSTAVRTMQSEYSQGQCDPNGVTYLDSPPMNPDEVAFMKPMGTFGGDHITPVDHMYVNYEPGTSHDVFAMADSHIVYIGHTGKDYRVIIEYSCNLYSIYIHIHELDAGIESQLKWIGGDEKSKGRSYSRIAVKSGTKIGRQTHNQSFDLSVVDTSVTLPGFVDLDSYRGEFWKRHCVDPYDYWKGSFRQELLDKTIVVNDDYPGGKIDYDVDGKLIGNWFEEGSGGYEGKRTDSDPHGSRGHLAIVYSALIPNKVVISFGSFQDGDSRRLFVNESAPDPANVGPSSGIVKYELWATLQGPARDGSCCAEGFEVVSTGERWFGDTYPEGGLVVTLHDQASSIMLVEMLDDRTIKLETFKTWDDKLKRRLTLDEISGFTDKYRIYKR